MALFLGIDGGGTKTACVVGDENTILGRGQAAGSNLVRLGEATVRAALHGAIRQACAEAKIDPANISRTCIGVAGAGRADVADKIRALIDEVAGGETLVFGDMEITLQAAFGKAPGIIVTAGTGSIAFGRNAEGQTARAGGWGFAISDEGSGHWIGQYAIAASMRARDEGASSTLLGHILKALALQSVEQLVLVANTTPSLDFARLLPAVLQAAQAGDVVATAVLSQAGRELADLGLVVVGHLYTVGETVPVAMSGGVFRNSRQVRETFTEVLNTAHHGVAISPTVVDPLEGALALARR